MTERQGQRRAIAAAVVGNVLEWYDFAVYGYLAMVIASQIFPAADEATALLSAFAAFGLGFLARPLGGIVIGRLGDRRGRKAALMLTMILMAVGTVMIGLVPNFATIGLAAPALVVLARLIQGFSAGGEWGGSTAFLVEWAPEGKRGLVGSLQQASVAGGLLLGSGMAALISTVLSEAALAEWGWRIPFLLGGVIAFVGLYLRRNVEETPAFRQAAAETAPAPETVPGWQLGARAFGFTVLWTVSYYIFLSYMPTFAQLHLGLERADALWSNTLGLLALVLLVPLFGALSDRIGRKPLLLACCAGFLILPYPLFSLMLDGVPYGAVIAIQIGFAALIAAFSGPGPAAIAEIFATRGRTTWMSVGYSLAVALFGGFAPFLATWLIATTGTPIAPVFYVMAAAAVSLLVIARLKETAHQPLR
jgi:MFS transporter, MHS family, proline/betaine transporter